MKLSVNQESILLKGLSSNVLQMSKPTIKVVNDMLKEWGLEITSTFDKETSKFDGNSFSLGFLDYKFKSTRSLNSESNSRRYLELCELTGQICDEEVMEYIQKTYPNALVKSPQYGEFTLSFDEAMDYLKKSDFKAKVTYESAINGTYVKRSSNEDFTMWADYDGIGNSKWYKFGQRINGDVCHSNEKWAIIA